MAPMIARPTNALISGLMISSTMAIASGRGLIEQLGLRTSLTASADEHPEAPIIMGQTLADQHLRVCNAFAHSEGLDISYVPDSRNLGRLEYKQCQDFQLPLKDGDQLDFHTDGLNVGTFAVSDVPASARTLLLIVHRREGQSMGATFKSHAFGGASADAAQVAVIDTYQGKKSDADAFRIMHYGEQFNASHPAKPENLPLNSVVAISPGSYQVVLDHAAETKSTGTPTATLSAQSRSSYVVLRVGRSNAELLDASYPEEIVVFPQLNGAVRKAAAFIVPVAMFMVHWMQI